MGTMLATTDALTGIAAVISAVGVIVVAVLQYLQRKPVAAIKETAEATRAAVYTANGDTVGQLVESIHSGEPTPSGSPSTPAEPHEH
jgi:hypothetical protein